MSDTLLGFLGGFGLWFLLEPIIINFVYLSNCDLFLDLVLLKSKRDKLVNCGKY